MPTLQRWGVHLLRRAFKVLLFTFQNLTCPKNYQKFLLSRDPVCEGVFLGLASLMVCGMRGPEEIGRPRFLKKVSSVRLAKVYFSL